MLDLRTLRSQCEERLHGITVPQPFRLRAFTSEIARHRGRELRLADLPGECRGTVTGCWLSTQDSDFIFTEPAASPWHRDLIVLHEFGHLLSHHDADLKSDKEDGIEAAERMVRALCPDLDPEAATARLLMKREDYSTEEELEAELTAALILARADTGPPPGINGDGELLLPRLAEALRHPVRHV